MAKQVIVLKYYKDGAGYYVKELRGVKRFKTLASLRGYLNYYYLRDHVLVKGGK